jgi:hypothetical protein
MEPSLTVDLLPRRGLIVMEPLPDGRATAPAWVVCVRFRWVASRVGAVARLLRRAPILDCQGSDARLSGPQCFDHDQSSKLGSSSP